MKKSYLFWPYTIAISIIAMMMPSTMRALTQTNGIYQISSAQDLIDFATLVNNGNKNANAKLTTNIDMSGKTFTPIGTSSQQYSGTFDGNEKSVNNLVFSNLYYNRGVFGYVGPQGKVQKLYLGGNSKITGNGNVGGIVGYNYGNISLCMVTSSVSISASVSYEAWAEGGTNSNFGGIAGVNEGTISSCSNHGYLSYTSNSLVSFSNFGGIAGKNVNNGKIERGQNTGTISGSANTGGIVGFNQATVQNSLNLGKVSGVKSSSGGIVGNNSGTVNNNFYAGSCTLGGIANSDASGKAMKGFTITCSDNRVSISLDGTPGLYINNTFYAGNGQTVKLNLTAEGYNIQDVVANGGTISSLGNNAYNLVMSNTNVTLGVTLTDEPIKVVISMGNNGIRTFCSSYSLDFSDVTGLKAYIASGFSPSTGELLLTRVSNVPAGEGLLLKGEEGDYEVPIVETTMFYSNLLKGVTMDTSISPIDDSYTNFILANGSHGIGFYTLSQEGIITAGKSYLQIPTSVVETLSRGVKLCFDDEDRATSISDNRNDKATNYSCFNMQGCQITKPAKGLYIVNGKKVLFK